MQKLKKILLVFGALTIMGIAMFVFKAGSTLRVNARNSDLNKDVESLFVGLQQYKEHVGDYPRGTNAEVARALKGENAKKVIIVVGKDKELNEKGEFVDDWGTPLRIYFNNDSVLIRSAGPNKKFDDSTEMNNDDFFRSN